MSGTLTIHGSLLTSNQAVVYSVSALGAVTSRNCAFGYARSAHELAHRRARALGLLDVGHDATRELHRHQRVAVDIGFGRQREGLGLLGGVLGRGLGFLGGRLGLGLGLGGHLFGLLRRVFGFLLAAGGEQRRGGCSHCDKFQHRMLHGNVSARGCQSGNATELTCANLAISCHMREAHRRHRSDEEQPSSLRAQRRAQRCRRAAAGTGGRRFGAGGRMRSRQRGLRQPGTSGSRHRRGRLLRGCGRTQRARRFRLAAGRAPGSVDPRPRLGGDAPCRDPRRRPAAVVELLRRAHQWRGRGLAAPGRWRCRAELCDPRRRRRTRPPDHRTGLCVGVPGVAPPLRRRLDAACRSFCPCGAATACRAPQLLWYPPALRTGTQCAVARSRMPADAARQAIGRGACPPAKLAVTPCRPRAGRGRGSGEGDARADALCRLQPRTGGRLHRAVAAHDAALAGPQWATDVDDRTPGHRAGHAAPAVRRLRPTLCRQRLHRLAVRSHRAGGHHPVGRQPRAA